MERQRASYGEGQRAETCQETPTTTLRTWTRKRKRCSSTFRHTPAKSKTRKKCAANNARGCETAPRVALYTGIMCFLRRNRQWFFSGARANFAGHCPSSAYLQFGA